MTASVGVVRYPTEAFAKGGNSNKRKLSVITLAYLLIMILQVSFIFYRQLSLLTSDITHNLFCDFW